MSFNDRCHEALYALRSGVPIGDIPEVRSALEEMLILGVEGVSFPPRGFVLAIRDRGKEAGVDLYNHECPGAECGEYGDRTCAFCARGRGPQLDEADSSW